VFTVAYLEGTEFFCLQENTMSDLTALLHTIASRLEAIESHLGISGCRSQDFDLIISLGGAASASSSSGAELPRSIRAFDAYCVETLDPFVAVCNKLGGDAATVGNLIHEAWMEMRAYLLMASACKEPPQASLGPLLTKLGEKTRAIGNTVQRNEWEKHTKTCQEGVQALNWLVVKPAPRDFIESYIGGSDYWANNIRREFRTTNPDQVAFCDNFKKMLQDLMVRLFLLLPSVILTLFQGICEGISYHWRDLEPKRCGCE
jgi:hypothetical protein